MMTFYRHHFGIEPPYNVIIDASFVREALKHKVDIWTQMPNYLCATVRLYTTSCALKEMEAFGKLLYGCLKVMKEYRVAPCPHKDHGVDPVDCLKKTVKKSHLVSVSKEEEKKSNATAKPWKRKRQYFLATQHDELARKVRQIPGVPILYLHRNAMQLEKTSEATLKAAGIVTQEKLVPKHEQETLEDLLQKEGIHIEQDGPIHHKKKLKGPNPLSVLKKRSGLKPLSKQQKISERRKWRKVRKLKKFPLPGTLQDLMLQEFALESLLGEKGMIYHRKRIGELIEKVTHTQ